MCLQRTDSKGRKTENIKGIRAVSVDLDGDAPLEPVQQCELKPHLIIESSPGRYWAHWAVKDLPLAEFEDIMRGIAKCFNGDPNIAELAHCCRMPGFEHAKDPSNRFLVRIVEENAGPAYTAQEIRNAFPPVKKGSKPLSRPTSDPLFMSPAAKRAYDEAKTKADRYILPDGGSPKLADVEEAVTEAAKLDPLSYELERRAMAESFGIRAAVLDEIVSERREEEKVVPSRA